MSLNRILTLLAIALCACVTAFAQSPAASPGEITIHLTAFDKTDKPIQTLKPEDLRILEDGVAQSITRFQPVQDENVSLAILIDTSISQEKTLGGQQYAATFFVTSTVRPRRDEAAVATFTNTLSVEQPLTDDVGSLRAAIQQARIIMPRGYVGGGVVVGPLPPAANVSQVGATAIWDSIIEACEQIFSTSTKDSRAIVLLTDGEDTVSKAKVSQAIDSAIRHHVVIYSVGIGNSKTYGLNKDALRRVSEPTGGRAFFPKVVGELAPVFDSIRASVRNQYAITYRPNVIGAKPSHKLRVEIVNPALKDVRLFYQAIVYQP